ncbi:SAM-dependent methyltransferase [Hyphomonas johnsonii]|uniref:Transcriptional regulator n=1 Tax=Hyphomonas johnsonii MHS-2 TaxID=1280950 RepID=A0A059FJ95_9PROT|nr:SAM-dependent methyltransferase [Hyphomonas johnsonii]KCZ90719.1 transcriptional regulator [Hyphomonas johnsonii MHS-2]
MAGSFTLKPVGIVRCDRSDPIDDDWDAVPTRIELDTAVFDHEALMGLDTFSHAEVIFLFDQVPDEKIVTGARHPRGNTDWPKIGIFAQRGKNRPNRLGATVCEILSVDGTVLHLKGLDAIDGTPVLDIKPVMSGFQPRGVLREPDWAKAIMETYW